MFKPTLLSVMLACGMTTTFAQNDGAGGISIAVRDAQQHSVAAATCSIFQTNDSRAIAKASTNGEGIALFPDINPGTYIVRVQAQGFEPANKTGIVVQASAQSQVTIDLAVALIAEDVTISTTSQAETSVGAGASVASGVIQRQSLRRLPLPTARVDEALPLVPGVVRSSTGEISIKGASEQQSALLVNGLNASDPATGNFRLNLPIDSVEAVQVFLHPYTAEYGQFTGGITDVETKRGGDRFHFELNDFVPDLRFRGGKIVGIAEDAPRLNISGPVVANRIYFLQSLAYTLAKRPVRGLSFPFNETRSESVASFTQLDFILSNRHTLALTGGFFPEHDKFVGLDFFRPQPVTPNYRQRDFVFAARDSYTLGGGLLQSAVSFKRFDATVWGQGVQDQTLTPTTEEGNYFSTQDRRSERTEFFEVYTFPRKEFIRGSHEIKLGFDFNRVTSRLIYSARPVNVVREDGTLAERTVFGAHSRIRAANREYVGFIQDRWTVRPNLSFDVGMRYEDQRIADEVNITPRAGFAWSPFGGDKTVVRGGIGLFYDKVPLNIRSFARYPGRTVSRYGPDGKTVIERRKFVNVLVDSAPVEPLDFRRSDRKAGFVPENVTWNVEVDQTVRPWLSLRANLTGSKTGHIYVVNPELDFRGQSAIVLRSAGHASYRALEMTARFKLNDKDNIYVSYVRSRARGDLNDFNSYFGDFGAPIIRANQYANLPFDVPHRLLAWGTISLPHRMTISPIFEVRSGFPYSVRDAFQNFVGVRNSDKTRFPRFLAMDAEISKDFRVTGKYSLRLSLRGFNLSDHFNPRDVRSNVADPRFGEFIAPYRRYFTGGFDIIF